MGGLSQRRAWSVKPVSTSPWSRNRAETEKIALGFLFRWHINFYLQLRLRRDLSRGHHEEKEARQSARPRIRAFLSAKKNWRRIRCVRVRPGPLCCKAGCAVPGLGCFYWNNRKSKIVICCLYNRRLDFFPFRCALPNVPTVGIRFLRANKQHRFCMVATSWRTASHCEFPEKRRKARIIARFALCSTRFYPRALVSTLFFMS